MQAKRIVVTCPDWRTRRVSPSPTLMTVAGMFCARIGAGDSNMGKINRALNNRLFKAIRQDFELTLLGFPNCQQFEHFTVFALLPKPYAPLQQTPMPMSPHRLGDRLGAVRQLPSVMKAGQEIAVSSLLLTHY